MGGRDGTRRRKQDDPGPESDEAWCGLSSRCKLSGRSLIRSSHLAAQSFKMALHPSTSKAVLATTGAGSDIVVLDASAGPSFGTELAHMEGRGSYGMSIAYVSCGRGIHSSGVLAAGS